MPMATGSERHHLVPLSGLTVLDLSSGPAGGMATMILADFGARVTRIIDREFNYLNEIPSARMWLRGKATESGFSKLLKSVDIIIITEPNSFTDIDYDSCKRVNPDVVYCSVTAFPEDSKLPLYEELVAAKLGRMKSMEGITRENGPGFSAVPVATHATSLNIVSGVLAAVFKRIHGGGGQKVTTSLAQGLMPYDQGASLSAQVMEASTLPAPSSIMPTLNYHPVQCADGKWLQLGNLLPHLFSSFMRVIGLEQSIASATMGREQREAVRDEILIRMQSRTRDEWMKLFVEDGGIAAHPYLVAEETLQDEDMTMNGHVIELDGVTQLGPLARLTRTPANISREAKENTGGSWRASADQDTSDTLPLNGITVLELATIIAAPLAASFLADMGARVIKVEAIGGEPYRHMAGGIGATRCNQGKESISVNLKSAEGQKIVQMLASTADILIHNYRPGVPERLGINYEELAKDNPDLIYISANGYGPNGPGALRPSTHPIPGAAMGGALQQVGLSSFHEDSRLQSVAELRESARRIMRANEVNPDPNTSMVICASSILGLIARQSSGAGQQIFVDMFGANAYANFDDMIHYDGKPARPSLGETLSGPKNLYRLYNTKDGWIFLGIKTDNEWSDFCRLAAPQLNEQFGGALTNESNEFSEALSSLFTTKTAQQWEALLLVAGIPCVVADRLDLPEFFKEEAHDNSPYMVKVRHEDFGEYYRHKPMLEFSTGVTTPLAGVRPGVDGQTILAAQGYSTAEIEDLFKQEIVWSIQ